MGHWIVVTFAAFMCLGATAAVAGQTDCFEHHASRYGLDAQLLRAIAHVESSGRPQAVNASHVSRTGTRDLGLMQINSAWLPRLSSYGITEADLFHGCTSVEVGAWVLHDLVRRFGNTWDAVGAYNAACSQLKGQACIDARSRYAWRVYRRLQVKSPASTALRSAPLGAAEVAAAGIAQGPAPLPATGLVSLAATNRQTAAPRESTTGSAVEGDS